MMRRSAGFDADKARRQLLKEWYNVPALELTANDYITCRVNSVDLKNRLRDIETDCRDRLHVWLLRIVGASTAPTSMALPCRWRSRPQHQNRVIGGPFDHVVGAGQASAKRDFFFLPCIARESSNCAPRSQTRLRSHRSSYSRDIQDIPRGGRSAHGYSRSIHRLN